MDVGDILGVEKAVKNEVPLPSKNKPKAKKGPSKRDHIGTLARSSDKPIFQAKRAKNSHWILEPIRSSARCSVTGKTSDDFDLLHWVKIHNVPDYRFARLNKTVRLLQYTEEEYENLLQDSNWSRAQTDKLMAMCKKYDLRFIIIHDRWTTEGDDPAVNSDKSCEDLKARFYSIQRELYLARNSSDPELQSNPMIKNTFDADYEKERKSSLSKVLRRSKNNITEVAQLVLENRSLTSTIKKQKKIVKEKNKSLGIAGKKRKRQMPPPAPVPPPQPLVQLGDKMADIPTSCYPPAPFKERSTGVFLRSSLILIPPQTKAKAVEQELSALGLKREQELNAHGLKKQPRPFETPTTAVANLYDKLRTDIITMVNLEKHVMQQEQARDIARQKAGLLPLGVGPPVSASMVIQSQNGPGTPTSTPKKQKQKTK